MATDTVNAGTITVTGKKLPKSNAKLLGTTNVLNNYRSYTYNFTLAVLSPDQVNRFDDNIDLKYIVFQSAGSAQPSSSFGEFRDFYIDNVNIEAVLAPNEKSKGSLPLTLTFDILEPYGINGFIAALQRQSLAAGFLNYVESAYVLKMEFKGYPDTDGPTPGPAQTIPMATRYFVFSFMNIELELTEKGTVYKCSCAAYHQRMLGLVSQVKADTTFTGKSVGDLLRNLMEKMEEQSKQAQKQGANSQNYDKYSIKFPKQNADGSLDKDLKLGKNDIDNAQLVTIGEDNALYKFVDPANSSNDGYKPNQQSNKNAKRTPIGTSVTAPVVQVAAESHIINIIDAVIRDSEWGRDLAKNIQNKIDAQGNFEFYAILTEVENQSVINPDKGRPFQNYTYYVVKRKTNISRVPGFANIEIKTEELEKIVLREYNYLYTGKNTDVLGFRLDFKNLYYQALPYALGNIASPSAQTAVGPNNAPNSNLNADNAAVHSRPEGATPRAQVPVAPVTPQGGSGGQPQQYSEHQIARNLFAAINSSVDRMVGDLEIIGDPFYLTMASMGKYNPSSETPGQTENGEAYHLFSDVLINLNFTTAIDIDGLEDGGRYFIDDDASFSGIYRVNWVTSSFSQGTFKQTLNILRVPGQIAKDQKPVNSDATKAFTTKPNTVNETREDTSPGVSGNGIRLNPQFLLGNVNLPAFTPAAAQFNLLPSLNSNAPTSGSPFPSPLSAGIRLAEAGLNSVLPVDSKLANASVPTSLSNLANKFNVDTSGINLQGPQAQAAFATALNKLGAGLPSNTDISRLKGLALDTVSDLKKIPASEPYSLAPVAPQDNKWLSSIGNDPTALARSYGVLKASEISQSLLPPGAVQEAAKAGNKINLLEKIKEQYNKTDVTALGGKILAVATAVAALKKSNLSKDTASRLLDSTSGKTSNTSGELKTGVNTVYGNTNVSPLVRIVSGKG